MTPKEKAIELINKYKSAPFNCVDCEMLFCEIKCTMLSNEEAKECALIAVDELIKQQNSYNNGSFYPSKYWQEVKNEIEKP